MKYALNLDTDGRILSATYEEYAADNAVLVDVLPDGDISDYLYINGEYVHSPLHKIEVAEQPTQLDRIESQLAYLAMITDNAEILMEQGE